jgi:hypothetical protein
MSKRLTFIYHNWRGEFARRVVEEPQFVYGLHPEYIGDGQTRQARPGEECWAIVGIDSVKQATRIFRLDRICDRIKQLPND